MRNVLRGFFGAILQSRIDGERHFRNFVNRRRNGWCFLKTVARAKRLQLIGINGVDNAVKEFAQPRIAVWVVAAFEHPIDGIVKIAARRVEVPGLEVRFACGKLFFDSRDQHVSAIWNRGKQRGWSLSVPAP